MRLYAHARHVYEDRGRRYFVEFAAGQWRDVPDAVGALLLGAHAPKFCDVSGPDDPAAHACPKTYLTSQYQAPETVVMVPHERVAAGRLATRRRAYKRSKVARVNPAARGA